MRFVKSEPDETISTGKEGEDGYRKLDNFEYPQVDSVEEAVTAAGDEKTLVDWMNGHFEKDSKNVGRVALRGVDSKADETTAYAKIRDLIRNWSPKGGEDGRKVNKKKAAAFDSIQATIAEKQAKGEPVTMELLQQLLAQAL